MVKIGLGIFYVSIELFPIFRVEGGHAAEHFIDQCAKGPPIRGFAIASHG
jgi:hypothetical protein